MRTLRFLAATALGLACFACSHDKAPDPSVAVAEVKPTDTAPADLAPLPEGPPALVTRKPGLRDPDLLNDLPNDRQFEPTQTVSSLSGNGALVTSPPPSVKATTPPTPEN
jgi:hypothetical protein